MAKAPNPGPHLGAMYNALYEEGTRDDLLTTIARLISENTSLRQDLARAQQTLGHTYEERDAAQDSLRDARERERLRDGGW